MDMEARRLMKYSTCTWAPVYMDDMATNGYYYLQVLITDCIKLKLKMFMKILVGRKTCLILAIILQ